MLVSSHLFCLQLKSTLLQDTVPRAEFIRTLGFRRYYHCIIFQMNEFQIGRWPKS